MPWNDNVKAGPWGAPPGGGDKDKGGEPKGDGDKERPEAAKPKSPWGAVTGGSKPPASGRGGDERQRRPGPGRNDGPPRGPDLDELTQQLRARLQRMFGGREGRGVPPRALIAGAGVILALWAASGFYLVQPDQEGVVTRFGGYARSSAPGLRYHLPPPFERVEKVSVTSLKSLDIGGAQGAPVPAESLMLTGDENILDLNFTVQWRIASASDYLFRVADADGTVKMVAESAMREVVGKTPLQEIITNKRAQVQSEAADLMQRILDGYGVGVSIVQVQIRSANPPSEVIPAFRDVNNANQDAESAANEARTYANRVVNEAKGDAARITQAAQGYREQVLREAQGSAARFDQVYDQYKLAPAVTRERLYLETMERVLARSNKVVVDAKGGTAPIVLPADLLRPQPNPASPAQGQTNSGGRPQ